MLVAAKPASAIIGILILPHPFWSGRVVTTPENPPSLISATQLLRCREPQWASPSYQFPMQTPPLTYPRLPVALTHAVTLGARTGWHDLM
jgi:hypothetical protein